MNGDVGAARGAHSPPARAYYFTARFYTRLYKHIRKCPCGTRKPQVAASMRCGVRCTAHGKSGGGAARGQRPRRTAIHTTHHKHPSSTGTSTARSIAPGIERTRFIIVFSRVRAPPKCAKLVLRAPAVHVRSRLCSRFFGFWRRHQKKREKGDFACKRCVLRTREFAEFVR